MRQSLTIILLAAGWLVLGRPLLANDPMLIPPTRVGSSNWGANESVNQMFSWATPVIGQPDPGYIADTTDGNCWDSAGEFNLIAWLDFGEDKTFSALDFATQINSDGFNRVKLWIRNDLATFAVVNGSTPPAGAPDLDVTCGVNGANFARYGLPSPVHARYVVAQFLSERVTSTSKYHPRAWELRMEGVPFVAPVAATLIHVWFSDPATFGFTLLGEVNRTYRIEASMDLVDWGEVDQVLTSAVETAISVPVSRGKPTQFFRASWVP